MFIDTAWFPDSRSSGAQCFYVAAKVLDNSGPLELKESLKLRSISIASLRDDRAIVRPTKLSYDRTTERHVRNIDTGTARFAELPKAEQVRYLQALWDHISACPDEIPVPESHLQLAEER